MTTSHTPTTAQRHEEICDQFLAHAREELASGDLLQAAEKAWGAVSHCVNSIAKQRGWPVGTHRLTINNARRLIDADPDPDQSDRLRLQLQAAQLLHRNFYEELMTADDVAEGISDAAQLVAALRRLASE